MKKLLYTAAVMLLSATFTHTQAQIRKIPAEVTEAFKAKYPNTKNAEWQDKITSFQVNYEMDDVKYQSKFSNKGEWIQTEKMMDEAALPPEVKDGYNKSKFTDWELKSVTWVQSRENGVQYRLYIRKNGLEKKYLYFDKGGRLVKDAITI